MAAIDTQAVKLANRYTEGGRRQEDLIALVEYLATIRDEATRQATLKAISGNGLPKSAHP